jgi:hypothetical protein
MPFSLRAALILVVLTAAQAPNARPAPQAQGPKIIGHNTIEYVYVQLARMLAASTGAKGGIYPVPDTLPAAIAVCNRIHPEAVDLSSSMLGFESWSYTYLRSACISDVAEWARAPELCDQIRVMEGPPPRALPAARERRYTPDECRAKTRGYGGPGWATYGNEMLVLLLGYSRNEMIKASPDGLLPEEGGAEDFVSTLLPVPSDETDYYARWEDTLRRAARLPDFSKGDAAALRQLDAQFEGWNVRGNTTRLALALRCGVQRLAPGTQLSKDCDDRM